MMRTEQPDRVVRQPDRVTFDYSDLRFSPIGMCAFCVQNENASYPARVGNLNKGLAKDVEGCEVIFPNGNTVQWRGNMTVPPGHGWLTMMAMTFGQEAHFTEASGASLPLWAVTTVKGTMVCEAHIPLALK